MPKQKKKLLILAILGILRDETDADHRIRQAEIITKLQEDYALTATRKSVRKNLGDLQEAGYPVFFRKGWYYDHGYSKTELNYLLSCISGSTLPAAQREALIGKLNTLGGPFFEPDIGAHAVKPVNPQFFDTTEIIIQAISSERQISFRYGNYDVDKELHQQVEQDGKPKLFHVNPYRLVSGRGRYFLIGSVEDSDKLSRFRVDLMLEVRLLKSAAKSAKKFSVSDESIPDDPAVPERLSPNSGPVRKARIQVRRDHINDLLDWFGMDVTFENVSDETVVAVVMTDSHSLDLWLRQSSDFASLAKS